MLGAELIVAALTGDLKLRAVTPGLLRGLAVERFDDELFALSYDFVGDLAETIALLWEGEGGATLSVTDAVHLLETTGKAGLPAAIAGVLDRLGASERLAFLKLATGNLRIGLSARLARTALAQMGAPTLDEIEEVWHGLKPPYPEVFAWVEGGPRPDRAALAPQVRPPDLVLWLQARPSTLLERVRRRGLDMEQRLSESALGRLAEQPQAGHRQTGRHSL